MDCGKHVFAELTIQTRHGISGTKMGVLGLIGHGGGPFLHLHVCFMITAGIVVVQTRLRVTGGFISE
jgi:hypothetical protein